MLNKHNLNIAKIAAKQQTSRIGINGIRVAPESTTATDGFMLAQVTTVKMDADSAPEIAGFSGATTDFAPFTLAVATALKIRKSLPKRCRIPILNFAYIGKGTENNGHVEIAVTDLESPQVFRSEKIEATYPDWEKVIPQSEHLKDTITVDADRLIALLQQAKELANKKNHAVEIAMYRKPTPDSKGINGEPIKNPDNTMLRIDVTDSRGDSGQHFMGLLCGMTE